MIMIHRVFSHDTGCDSADHSHDRMLKQYMIGSGNYPNIGIRVKESHSGKFSDIASFFNASYLPAAPGSSAAYWESESRRRVSKRTLQSYSGKYVSKSNTCLLDPPAKFG